MNDVKVHFDKIYSKIGYYLSIDEKLGNWGSNHKILPIKIMLDDFIPSSCDFSYQNDYIETTLLSQHYFNNYTIYDSLIRKGILQRKVEISDSQLDRICNPCLADDNNSLIHKLSCHTIVELKKLFTTTSIADYFNQSNKRYPIFLNFKNESPIDKAMDSFDFESFEYLLQ